MSDDIHNGSDVEIAEIPHIRSNTGSDGNAFDFVDKNNVRHRKGQIGNLVPSELAPYSVRLRTDLAKLWSGIDRAEGFLKDVY